MSQPQRREMMMPQRGSRRRLLPHLNTRSPYLVHLYKLSKRLSGRRLKDVIERSVGRVVFVETFEAWNNNFGSLIFEFDDPYVQRKFLKMPHAWIERHFGGIPTARVLLDDADRQDFFDIVLEQTGVDLLECGGVPPARWEERVAAARADPMRVRPPRVRPPRVEPTPVRPQRAEPMPVRLPRVEPTPFIPPRVEPARVKKREEPSRPLRDRDGSQFPSVSSNAEEEPSPERKSAAARSKPETESSLGARYIVQIKNFPPDWSNPIDELEKLLRLVLPLTWSVGKDCKGFVRAGFKDLATARLAAMEWEEVGLEVEHIEEETPSTAKANVKREEDERDEEVDAAAQELIDLISFTD